MLRKIIGLITGDPSNEWPARDTFPITGASDLDREIEERYIKLVALSNIKCQLAEARLQGIDGCGSDLDLDESERLGRSVTEALALAAEIDDEFYRSAALHPIAEILTKAGKYARANEIIGDISVEFISEEAFRFLEWHKESSALLR